MPQDLYQPRQYYCLEPKTSACREGFRSLPGWKQHREAIHKVPHFKSRLPQHPHVPDHVTSEDEPDGAYYVQHPILDGIVVCSISAFHKIQLMVFYYDTAQLLGTPCDIHGDDLPSGSPPILNDNPNSNPWEPFKSRAHFKLADFTFRRNAMPSDQFNELMEIWAGIENKEPPFASTDHLHNLIDSIPEGDLPWCGMSIKHVDAEQLQENPNTPSWKLAEYDFWFRDAKAVIKRQLSNPAFKDSFDYAPKQIFGEQHQRVWGDFMTGNWAWKQCVSKFCMLRTITRFTDSVNFNIVQC